LCLLILKVFFLFLDLINAKILKFDKCLKVVSYNKNWTGIYGFT
jgi:hypothetical protein